MWIVRISFRYRFIISFVLLEIVFLSMIAVVNFSSLERNSNRLIDERIKSITSLGSELLMTPLSIYDLATLDNIIYGLKELEGIERIELYDANGKELSSLGTLVDSNSNIVEIKEEIIFDSIKLGKLNIWLNLSTNYAELKSNRHTTYLIIFLEIIVSTVLSFLIGFRLSKNLNIVSDFVQEFGRGSNEIMPKLKGDDEVTELAETIMVMQNRINERNDKLTSLNNKLNHNVKILKEYENAVDKGSILSRGDLKGNITYVNDNMCKITGYSKEELIGKPHSILRHPNTPKKIFQKMWNTLHRGEIWHGVLKNLRKDGTSFYVDITIIPVRDHENRVVEYLALRHDVSELVKSKTDLRIPFQTDLLTSIGNRYNLFENIKSLEKPYLAMIDIRHFNQINTYYGHEIGDQVIKAFGESLFSFFQKEYYLVFRINADEFAVLAEGTSVSREGFVDDIKQFQQESENNILHVMGVEINILLTVGIAFEDKKDLVANTSCVLQSAKEKNLPYLVYTDDIKNSEGYQKNIFCTAKLMKAIKADQITSYYQPIVNNLTGEVEKYESLVRMKDEDGTVISPHSFIDIAKKARLYPEITKTMIDACMDGITKYNKEFSLNLSGDDLVSESTMSYLYSRLDEFDQRHKMTFEILETESLSNYDALEHFHNNIKEYGCKIAIDDFGTGYANFDYIIKLNPDYIKIDGSMIKDIDQNENTYNVVAAIVEFASINGIKTIAEYVLNESVYNSVCDLGIDYSQGYFFGKAEPIPIMKL